jgi:hypothetical protein
MAHGVCVQVPATQIDRTHELQQSERGGSERKGALCMRMRGWWWGRLSSLPDLKCLRWQLGKPPGKIRGPGQPLNSIARASPCPYNEHNALP